MLYFIYILIYFLIKEIMTKKKTEKELSKELQSTAQLHQKLWNIADTLRGWMDASDFKNYMLWFIFYKYLSEKIEKVNNKYLKEEKEAIKAEWKETTLPETYSELDFNNSEHKEYFDSIKEIVLTDLGYNLKPDELFSKIVEKGEKGEFILNDLETVLKNIEASTMGTSSEDDFSNLFEAVDLHSSKLGKNNSEKNEKIVKILSYLNEIDFKLDDVNSDVLGDAYEYLISQFASSAGKKAGEFYTPQSVSKILAKIVSAWKDKLKSVYDPTCGSGSLLIRTIKEVKEVWKIYWQEKNPTTYNLARMNMLLHDVHYSKFDIKNDDTLTNPRHLGKKFEAIVANPPFSLKWEPEKFKDDERFTEYWLAPKSNADYAFIEHMLYHLADEWTMATVMPLWVLFRWTKPTKNTAYSEYKIRRYLVENKNYLDAVIWLPVNIFFWTWIPSVILVFKKCRKKDDKVLFIDASKDFKKERGQYFLLEEHINKIIDTYQNKKEIEKYSHLADLKEIEENDFNLNIPRYVDTFEKEEIVDIKEVAEDIKEIKKELEETEKTINWFCKELGIDNLF